MFDLYAYVLPKVPLHGTRVVFAITRGLFLCSMEITMQCDMYELVFCDWLIFLEFNWLNLYDLIHSQYINQTSFWPQLRRGGCRISLTLIL